jgi:hypothetical protein
VVQRGTDKFTMVNPESGCAIEMLEPRPLPGSLQELAEAIFKNRYAGWRFRQTGAQQYLLSTGVLPKGLEYFMMEAEVTKDGGEFGGILEGAALTVKAGSQIVMMWALHKPLMTGHRPCWATYATWRRFFNSFTVRNTPIVKTEQGELSRRIVGRWKMAQGGLASGELVFAANGTYTSGGAFGGSQSRATTSRDSSYSLAGDQLSMRTSQGSEELVRVRFDRVSHGGTGWKDRLWMLKKDMYGENEVSYERIE